MATPAQAGGGHAPAGPESPNDMQRQQSNDGNPALRRKRDTLARTGPLLALLIPVLGVYGLATLAGYLTDTVVLIIAIIMLLIATFVVISGVIRMASAPPDDDDEDAGHPAH